MHTIKKSLIKLCNKLQSLELQSLDLQSLEFFCTNLYNIISAFTLTPSGVRIRKRILQLRWFVPPNENPYRERYNASNISIIIIYWENCLENCSFKTIFSKKKAKN
ncbi:hypothetical protein BpHYR1_021319 [Brachionus plicatilis]|uniref:Uncharacterized protein n=1 Tax=Brachionus plicatilis TaxID=10195 RepID=A0A3M7T6M1_BRAPC|nr:hypothetical protein BpHYR1_021319 [Brachionus plicatilis]